MGRRRGVDPIQTRKGENIRNENTVLALTAYHTRITTWPKVVTPASRLSQLCVAYFSIYSPPRPHLPGEEEKKKGMASENGCTMSDDRRDDKSHKRGRIEPPKQASSQG